jgi:hypothetical protein
MIKLLNILDILNRLFPKPPIKIKNKDKIWYRLCITKEEIKQRKKKIIAYHF